MHQGEGGIYGIVSSPIVRGIPHTLSTDFESFTTKRAQEPTDARVIQTSCWQDFIRSSWVLNSRFFPCGETQSRTSMTRPVPAFCLPSISTTQHIPSVGMPRAGRVSCWHFFCFCHGPAGNVDWSFFKPEAALFSAPLVVAVAVASTALAGCWPMRRRLSGGDLVLASILAPPYLHKCWTHSLALLLPRPCVYPTFALNIMGSTAAQGLP